MYRQYIQSHPTSQRANEATYCLPDRTSQKSSDKEGAPLAEMNGTVDKKKYLESWW